MLQNMFKDSLVENMKLTSALNHRILYLSDDIDESSCFKLNYFLDRLIRLDEKEGTKEPITIIINSAGGSVYEGLSCISRIEKMIEEGYEIISIIDGMSFSMGSAISQVCSKRYARRYSTILYHQVSGGERGTLADVETSVEEQRRLWELVKAITIKHTNMTEEYLDEIYKTNRDFYMSPELALSLGVIDAIL